MTDVVVDATPKVVTVKVADVLPAGTVTLFGTVAAAVLLLERVTTEPPVGAATLSRTVPVELFPPTTEVGLNVNDVRVTVAAVPVPARLTVCGLPAALSLTDSVPLREPLAVGVKVTLIVHVPLAAKVAGEMGQLLV
jgi:hypothetical protein